MREARCTCGDKPRCNRLVTAEDLMCDQCRLANTPCSAGETNGYLHRLPGHTTVELMTNG